MNFKEVFEKYSDVLEKYVPVVDKVHGGHHPEFHDVRAAYEAIVEKVGKTGYDEADLTSEFDKLLEVTDNYELPGDVCETYEAVFKMLKEMDASYRNR